MAEFVARVYVQWELTAALVLFAYQHSDLGAVDHAARIVLNYQAS